jgi:hypothetical protein
VSALSYQVKDRSVSTPFKAHSPFGGSVAGRILRCPASVGLVAKVPAHLRRVSTYADRGSACHAAIARLLDGHSFASVVGTTFNGYALTLDDVDYSVRPVFAYVDKLLTPGVDYYVECHLVFPGITNTFGTVDLLARSGNTVYIVDYKFGSGVRVAALSPADDDPEVDIINSQLLFYACSARHSLPDFFAGVERIILVIAQPQSIEPEAEMVSFVEVTHAELDEFIEAYRAACAEALSPTPRLQRGPHCRFCPARPICPEFTKPLLNFAQFAAPTLRDSLAASLAAPPDRAAYLEVLAAGLNLVDAVKDLSTTLRDQARCALQNGDVVPGWTLTAGRAERAWRDDERSTIAALKNLGLILEDIVTKELRSPKQIEIRAKARGLKIPQELISTRRSGTSLARVENAHTPVPGRGEIAQTFARALEAFQGGRRS